MKNPILWFLLVNLITFSTACTPILKATNDGPIQQDKSTRTVGDWVDDNTIETVAQVNITKADPALEQSHIVVTSYDGIVLLTGQVANERLRNLAGDVARNVKKVRRVYNELEIGPATTFLIRSNDSWLTSKIKTKMLAEKNFPAGKIKIVTENGIVYLMGKVNQSVARQAVDISRTAYGVQKIVKIFDYTD
ncbi:BON domain-containing protein [Zooshikella marina]|uniref:BON domain-containing protein n=1 Tax=Zooshikella ganghwensis TaxID=202772 RepID=A0A4P9VQX4_9GAMM|nr:BON domain-containing protein [Zooshikella ganghwensis]MBU2707331.1 BON domain-containing protein [Zooshikella ganghwensis]RDH45436.1 BON domain-containing protein [Zooshikella ganghwensis]